MNELCCLHYTLTKLLKYVVSNSFGIELKDAKIEKEELIQYKFKQSTTHGRRVEMEVTQSPRLTVVYW